MVQVTGPVTPYVTPAILTNAPTGIAWRTIPSVKADPSAQLAEQMNICVRATAMVDTACNNVLRATIDTETLTGPDYRITINPNTLIARLLLSRYPVTSVLSGQWAPTQAAFGGSFQTLPASQFIVERPPIGLYGTSAPSASGDGGQSVLLAPGNISWQNGRNGCIIKVTYVNGWPHASITASAAQGAMSVQVDDCTGWAPPAGSTIGAAGTIYDGTDQEAVTCTGASAQSGPGTLTLGSGLTYAHGAGTVISALPGQIMQATILFAVSEALIRGATATTINSIAGTGSPTGSADHFELKMLARELCMPYRRMI